MKMQRSILLLLPVMICYLISINKPFFWDTTHLASAQAQWFYGNGLNTILLPDEIDSGHPPLTGWLLAGWWKLAGKGLLQSHIFILPFLMVAVWQMMLVLKHYFPDDYQILGWLFFLNPILLTQSMLVSPDLVLFAGFFLALHGVLKNHGWKIIAGSILLAMVSMRGMVCVAALAIFGLIKYKANLDRPKSILNFIVLFLPSALISASFLLFHYYSKGWIGYHPGSPWSPSFEAAGLTGFLRNIVVLAWRFADQGMIFIWIVPAWIFFKHTKPFSSRTRELLILFAILMVMLVVPQLFYKYLLMHRYLYPCIALLTMAGFSLVLENARIKKYIFTSIVLMLSGFVWIYPEPVSKGWDIMPLHYSYYSHRAEILEKMKLKNIDYSEIGAAFPYEMPSSVIDLTNNETKFAELNLDQNKYVLYSNISNDFSDEAIETLKKSWIPVEKSGTWPVYFILYKRPANP